MAKVLYIKQENTTHLKNVHTFERCNIYKHNISGRLDMVWNDAASYTLIRDLHQYNAEQSQQFDAYITAVQSSTAANITEPGGIADGRFIFEDKKYCVRGKYIYPIERLEDQLNAVAAKLHRWYDADATADIESEIKSMCTYNVYKMYSMQDILTIWSKFINLIAAPPDVITSVVKDLDNILYLCQVHCKYNEPNVSNDKFHSDTIYKFITTPGFEYHDEKLNPSSNSRMVNYVAELEYKQPNRSGDTRSAGIYNSKRMHARQGLCGATDMCYTLTCLQMIYHMTDIVECSKQRGPNDRIDNMYPILDTFSKHIQYMKNAEMTETKILNKYDAKLYLHVVRIYKEYNPPHRQSLRKQYIPSTVHQRTYHDMYYMLSILYTESPEIAMWLGSTTMRPDVDTTPIVFDCMLYITHTDNVWQSITDKCQGAPTHQPYIIVWLPMADRQDTGTSVMVCQYWHTIPVCVVNTITNTPFRLTGSMAATPNHTYYVDYAERVVYDDAETLTTPNAMYRKAKSSRCNEQNFVEGEYIEAIQYNHALLYVRDVI